jgi:menaquinol-cytochrome c reductase iron-sulfur subunit
MTDPLPTNTRSDRRNFFIKAGAIVCGSLLAIVPLASAVAVFISPVWRKHVGSWVRVALLDQVPDNGKPVGFPVITDREDAWNRYPAQRIGAVYLVRKPGVETPTAFTATCPHAGCFIGYTPGQDHFQCPCHTSAFNFDGTRVNGDREVAPRGMDSLEVEVRPSKADSNIREVWVHYERFQTGKKEKIPVA